MKKQNTKLVYFLRGLGFGIVFVTAVVGISSSRKSNKEIVTQELSREEIIEKAKEIGMVEGVDMKIDALLDATPTPEATEQSSASTESSTPEATKTPVSETPAATDKPSNEISKKSFTIKSGQPAEAVAKKLKNEGLIDDEKAFHTFLKDNKYATKLIAGRHEITIGGDYETIAKELCENK